MSRRPHVLRVRMVLTLLFLLAVNVLFVRTAVWFLTGFVPWMAVFFFTDDVPVRLLVGVRLPVSVLLVLSVLFLAWQYRYSRARLDAVMYATDAPEELVSRVQRLARQVDLEPPEVRVLEYERPNSMVYGTARAPRLAVTRGLLETADDETLDAVIAHELAHVSNGDLWLTTLLNSLPVLTSDLHAAGETGTETIEDSELANHGYGSPNRLLGFVYLVASATTLLSKLFRVASLGGFALFSRFREYAADEAAAEIVGSRASIAAALAELDVEYGVPDQDARKRDRELRSVCFLPHGFGDSCFLRGDEPLDPAADGESGTADRRDRHLFGTHPDTDARVERLTERVE